MKRSFYKLAIRFKISLLYALASILLCTLKIQGQTAFRAQITRIQGPNNISLRINGRPVPANVNTVLGIFPDALTLPGDNRTIAELGFLDRANEALGIRVQTRTRNNLTTQYYFPCRLSIGGSAIIEWQNLGRGGSRGCNECRVASNGHSQAQSPSKTLVKHLEIAQSRRSQFQSYCSVTGHSGESWIGFSITGDPCQVPIETCQSNDSQCTLATLDRWISKESDLTVIVACENNQDFSVKGDGSTLQGKIEELWRQAKSAGATFCALHVLSSNESIVSPQGESDRTLIQVENTDSCLLHLAFQGNITVRSARRPEGVPLSSGAKYVYCEEDLEDLIDTFDTSIEPIDLQLFLAEERGLELCDSEQASGGQVGDIRTIQLTADSGEIEISYEMYDVPDRLIVTYEGSTILDTDFVSGSRRLSIPFRGNSAQVKVEVIGNRDVASTKWQYTLYCPQ